MTRPTPGRRTAALLATLTLLATGAAGAWAHPAGQTWVPFRALLAQVRSGPLIRAIINPARADVEIKFRNLDEWHAYYPPRMQPELQRLLRARHIRVLFVPRPHAPRPAARAAGHPVRYMAAGALAGLLLMGAMLYLRRRRASARPPVQEQPSGER